MSLPRRRLPHLYVTGRPLFITFRLKDALPSNHPFHAECITSGKAFLAVDRMLDTARTGAMYLKQPEIAQVVIESILKGVELGHYDLHAWVVMSNHVHMLFTPHIKVSDLMRSLKRTTAARANQILHRTGQPFWQEESFDRLVRNDKEFRRTLRYIESNPVKAGLVSAPQDYPWSRRAACPLQAVEPALRYAEYGARIASASSMDRVRCSRRLPGHSSRISRHTSSSMSTEHTLLSAAKALSNKLSHTPLIKRGMPCVRR
jgi:putative transposase